MRDFVQQHIGEQAGAHADTAMDAPDGERNAFLIQRFFPGEHVLIDAIDQRDIEIKNERDVHGSLRAYASVSLPSR